MKSLFIAICIVISIASAVKAQDYAVKIRINSAADIAALKNTVTRFEDVKIKSNNKFSYNEENGFITAICTSAQLESLNKMPFTILSTERYIKPEEVMATDNNTIPYQFGWPRTSTINWAWYESSATVADMNMDGNLEVAVTHSFNDNSGTPLLFAYKHTGAFVVGYPFSIPFGTLQNSGSMEINAMGDIDGDGQLEIVHADENGNIYAHKYDGSMVPGFPYVTSGTNEHSVPALFDLNRDGKDEIIITSRNRDNDLDAQLHVLTAGATTVTQLPGFPISYDKGTTSSPVVSDVDNDGRFEIFVGTGYNSASSYEARILCYTEDGVPKSGWPVMTGTNSVGSSVTLYDINGDNKKEAIIRVKIDTTNGIYAFDPEGNVVAPFPFYIQYGHPDANVSVGDMDGDGQVEIGFGNVEAVSLARVHVWKLNGSYLPGFPRRVYATWVDGSTAMGDVTGDGVAEIIAPTNQGKIYAFTATGDSAKGFPLSSEATSLNAFNSSPTIVDLDRDGDVEIIAPCNDRKVYCWDTPGIYDSSKVWSTYKGNHARTGTQARDIIVGIQPNSSVIPSKYSLSQNYPNPFNPSTSIKFALPKNGFVKLSVYNSLGQVLAVLVNRRLQAGEYNYSWNAAGLGSGVYFYKLETEGFSEIKKMLLIK